MYRRAGTSTIDFSKYKGIAKNKVINSDAENIILILMNMRYMSGRWYTWDLHIVAIDI
jgi:hypothetical protein